MGSLAAPFKTGKRWGIRAIGVPGRAPDWIDIEVADRGGGIPEEQFDRLFQPFFTTKPNGVGMGLQICRSIIEAMGGELTARNRPHGGAVFSCKLPVHTVHALE